MFRFLKIIQPVWYFHLRPSIDHGYFPEVKILKEQFPELAPDSHFSEDAAAAELSYRAHRLGFTGTRKMQGMDWWMEGDLKLVDEYRFIRKYFHITRVVYVLLSRILSLHNPVAEISAFINSKSVSRFKTDQSRVHPEGYKSFNSELINSNPAVTVIIPTLNRYPYLADVLRDLESQSYKNFDVIVVDQSEPFHPEFFDEFNLKLHVIRQEEKALWKARNSAIEKCNSPLLLFYDDDSRVGTDWMEQHLKCLDFFNADISSGVSISKSGAPVPENYRFFRWSDQLDTGNVMIRRSVFEMVGLYDRQFEKQRMGDGEFGMRCYLAGLRNISNPFASRLHLKVGEGGLREMGNWDAFRPKSFWSPRPVPSVFYFYRKYFGNRQTIRVLLQQVFPSLVPYKFKNNRMLLFAGSIVALFLSPLVAIQVVRSWRISGRMLQSGEIEFPKK